MRPLPKTFKNKLVLLRSDINSDVKRGKVIPNQRIRQAKKTISFLKSEKAKVVVIAHQGNRGKNDFLSLKQHSKLLKIPFISDTCGSKAISKIKSLKSGQAILLENLRFEDSETNPKESPNKLIKNLAPLFDYYINDAFSVSHRSHTSITKFPEEMPAFPGPLLKSEIKALEKISIKKCLYILGGGKPEADFKLLGKNTCLAAGFFGQMCLIAKGKNLGFQNKFLRKNALVKGDYDEFLKSLKRRSRKVILPKDFAIIKDGKRKELPLTEFPSSYEIRDIGAETITKFSEEIKKAPAIYMKGPLGLSSDPRFSKGTIEILKEISKSPAFSIVGGGHLSEAIKSSKISKKKFNHVSLSGGALLSFIAGEKLPGAKGLRIL